MPKMSSPSCLSNQKVVTNSRPTNYYDDLFDFASVYTRLIGESERCQNSTPVKVDNVDVDVDDDNDDVVYYLTSRRDVRLRQHEIKSKKKPNSKINLKKK
jgi:hypothetical protein